MFDWVAAFDDRNDMIALERIPRFSGLFRPEALPSTPVNFRRPAAMPGRDQIRTANLAAPAIPLEHVAANQFPARRPLRRPHTRFAAPTRPPG